MRARHAFFFAATLGCSVAAVAIAAELESSAPRQAPVVVAPTATPVRPTDRVTVELTAVSLGDDCGDSVAPKRKKSGKAKGASAPAAEKAESADSASKPSLAARRPACDGTSLQLSVFSPAGLAATSLTVKKVELYDDKGKLVGELLPKSPTMWSAPGAYVPWDGKIAPNQTISVSYPLTAPNWASVKDRWNKSFTVKAVVTVGGKDEKLQRDTYVVGETHLPPDVVT